MKLLPATNPIYADITVTKSSAITLQSIVFLIISPHDCGSLYIYDSYQIYLFYAEFLKKLYLFNNIVVYSQTVKAFTLFPCILHDP